MHRTATTSIGGVVGREIGAMKMASSRTAARCASHVGERRAWPVIDNVGLLCGARRAKRRLRAERNNIASAEAKRAPLIMKASKPALISSHRPWPSAANSIGGRQRNEANIRGAIKVWRAARLKCAARMKSAFDLSHLMTRAKRGDLRSVDPYRRPPCFVRRRRPYSSRSRRRRFADGAHGCWYDVRGRRHRRHNSTSCDSA